MATDKSQEKEQVADKNANVPETAEPMTVSSSAGIQETSVAAEVENQQQQFPTPSPNVAVIPDKHQEKEQISDDANATETADPMKVSSSSVSVENQQQPTPTTSPNVGYVTVVSAQTSPNMKRRNSNEIGKESKRARATSEAGDAFSTDSTVANTTAVHAPNATTASVTVSAPKPSTATVYVKLEGSHAAGSEDSYRNEGAGDVQRNPNPNDSQGSYKRDSNVNTVNEQKNLIKE
ncbi:uncharacterized protein LOC124261192 [Haliotis rubra]|uniref:uncharacterized protein LOC124261192 n=1 Tax=Haliotis rubra TaxID=36100 RepID=UPI001EE53D36|nr:uncharacterized protein LOC124261192 [Haliotis rubra]